LREDDPAEEKRMNRVRNYQKELDKILDMPDIYGKRLLLHACCAPCSSYCLEYLREYFDLTVFYYNPNITEDTEYWKRVEEEKRLIAAFNAVSPVFDKVTEKAEKTLGMKAEPLEAGGKSKGADDRKEDRAAAAGWSEIKIIEGSYDPARFYEISKGLEQCPEGGERCFRCYELRLRETARVAGEQHFDYFTTTLTISPLKNAAKLNEIGERLGEEFDVAFLPSDFKKRNGYKRSIELSREYHLYRQDYCGCVYSLAQRNREKEKKEAKPMSVEGIYDS